MSLGRVATSFSLVVLASCGAAPEPAAAGTVEYTETDIAATVPARVLSVRVEEGQRVAAGDTLVILTQSAIDPERETRRARVAAAEAELRDLRSGARANELERGRAEVRAAQSDAERARREADRFKSLLASGSISAAQLEAMESAATVAEQRLASLRETLLLLELGARPDRVRAAEAGLRQARAQLAAVDATASDLVLVAPQAGIVLGRHAEPGEVIGAGIPTISLGDPRRLWVRVYVSTVQLAALSIGAPAELRIEGLADRGFRGSVVSLATAAEFTPRVAMTEQERADLLFGVKIAIDDSSGVLKAGLPVVVRFPVAQRPPANP